MCAHINLLYISVHDVHDCYMNSTMIKAVYSNEHLQSVARSESSKRVLEYASIGCLCNTTSSTEHDVHVYC
jgi:hypothetical protein